MNFQLSANLYVIVTKFNGYPQIQFRNCVTKMDGGIIPTREGINIILPQYAKLIGACKELLIHKNNNKPLEVDLGYKLSVRNKICKIGEKRGRKIVFFNDRTCGSFEISLEEFNKWCDFQAAIENAIISVKTELIAEKIPKQEPMEKIDFASGNITPIENAFTHLCALLARRAVNRYFPCMGCHNNMSLAEGHTCTIDEAQDLRDKSMGEIVKLLIHCPEMIRKKFTAILNINFKNYVVYADELFDTFYCAFLKTFAGRMMIYDIVNSSVCGDFGSFNPQSLLMYDIAYIVLEEDEFYAPNE